MSMHGGGSRIGARVSSADFEAQKRANSEAPKVENLGGRIRELFIPYRVQLVVVVVLVVVGASLGIVPPLLTA
ncbi:MAG: ABC transporter ATP-binding protein, partial [Actinobacteria bacterium]|nr:ABC transporter ATP-binding protein [Actinomycetota bacterium]